MSRSVSVPARAGRGAPRSPVFARSDERLARLVARDGQAPFAELYERYHQALYRYCRSIVRDEDDAEDALQSAMASAFAALRKGERDLAVRPWLYRIAHNESISLLRRRRPQELATDELALAAPANISEPQLVIEQRERFATLLADLRSLTIRQRSALVMRELSGLSIDEIAAVSSSTPGAVKQTLFEAREALRENERGRSMECEQVRSLIFEDDRRALRGRRVRSHLDACDSCGELAATIATRRQDLLLLAPPLPAVAATALLSRLLDAGAGVPAGAASGASGAGGAATAATSGSGGTGAAASGIATGSAAAHAGGALAAKVLTTAVVVAAGAAGVAGVASTGSHHGGTARNAGSLRDAATQNGAGSHQRRSRANGDTATRALVPAQGERSAASHAKDRGHHQAVGGEGPGHGASLRLHEGRHESPGKSGSAPGQAKTHRNAGAVKGHQGKRGAKGHQGTGGVKTHQNASSESAGAMKGHQGRSGAKGHGSETRVKAHRNAGHQEPSKHASIPHETSKRKSVDRHSTLTQSTEHAAPATPPQGKSKPPREASGGGNGGEVHGERPAATGAPAQGETAEHEKPADRT